MVGGGGGYGVVVVEGQVEKRNEAEDADFKGKNEGKNPRLGVALSSPNQISPDEHPPIIYFLICLFWPAIAPAWNSR